MKDLKEFERVIKRYGVDFAVMKETKAESPRFLVFFKEGYSAIHESGLSAECIERPKSMKDKDFFMFFCRSSFPKCR